MYTVKPKGINIRDNERIVADGFLQESINLQWRDGAYRPIPERLDSGITDTAGKDEIILHKVSDEDKINVLMFDTGVLKWFGTIENGTYTAKVTPETITGFPTVTDFDSFSFTILNSLIYFMSSSQEFYYRLQFNEVDDAYELKDMYAWKDLIPFYPESTDNNGRIPLAKGNFLMTQCGVILTRFTLVLDTGEEVLHSPIYANYMYAINTSVDDIKKDDLLTNIHTKINTNLEFIDQSVFDEEVSAINIYASNPYYITKVVADMETSGIPPFLEYQTGIDSDVIKGEVQRMAEEPFYLAKTLDKNSDDEFENNVLFYVGELDIDIEYPNHDISKINTMTLAAGQLMPVDNFSYHKIFGKLTSSNGRLIVNNIKTYLSSGHIRALALDVANSKVGFYIDTEDGLIKGISFSVDKSLNLTSDKIRSRGLLSYPDSQASYVGGNSTLSDPIRLYKTRANSAHNMACAFNFENVLIGSAGISVDTEYYTWGMGVSAQFFYGDGDIITPSDPPLILESTYTSENRLQFSEIGEFSVWPAINSYRVGEGKIRFVGSNSIDPANSDYIAPLLVGTSDGVYTVNFDVTGTNLIQSITKAASVPAISSENIQIDQALVYVSDKGLIVINSGKIDNLTRKFFPDKASINFPVQDNLLAVNLSSNLGGVALKDLALPNYDLLTEGLLQSGVSYDVIDIVEYMKGAIFAYDGRRNNLWCSNSNKSYSLIYNLETQQWDQSTYIFNNSVDFFSTITTNEGDLYSRHLILNKDGVLDVLSGENSNEQIDVLLLTRPIKMQSPDKFKKIDRLISRCELYRDNSEGSLILGIWGKQDMNKNKVNIPLVAYKDSSIGSFPDNIRQDIPLGSQKGKYKVITILQGGRFLPNSSLDGYEIVAIPVNNRKIR